MALVGPKLPTRSDSAWNKMKCIASTRFQILFSWTGSDDIWMSEHLDIKHLAYKMLPVTYFLPGYLDASCNVNFNRCDALISLLISANEIASAGAKELASTLNNLTNLESLDLRCLVPAFWTNTVIVARLESSKMLSRKFGCPRTQFSSLSLA